MRGARTPGELAEEGGTQPIPAPRVAMGVVAAVFVSITLIGFLHVLMLPVGPGEIMLSFGAIVILMLIQLAWYARDRGRVASPLGFGILAVQACLVYLPILVFGQAWVGMPGFFAGSLLLVLPPVAAWASFSLVVLSMGFAQWLFTATPMDMLYTSISTVTTGLVVYGLSKLTALVAEVQKSRAEIARMAVLRERLRFARDLHDLLGYSLSAITLKIELTHRLLKKSPREASDQLLEILQISRLALSDARTVASGYRELSLEEECRSALSVLRAADINVRFDSDQVDLPVQVSTVLATVLREAVTNLLRHSKAKHCDITVRQTHDTASIEIVNDDIAEHPVRRASEDAPSGSGLRNLTVRAKEIGGTLKVGRTDDLFTVRAEVPLRIERHMPDALAELGGLKPAGLTGDADRVDPVAGGELADDRGEVVPDGSD